MAAMYDKDGKSKRLSPILYDLITQDDVEAVKEFISEIKDFSIETEYYMYVEDVDITLLWFTVDYNSFNVFKFLITEYKASVDTKNYYGIDMLVYTIGERKIDFVKFLIEECEADVNRLINGNESEQEMFNSIKDEIQDSIDIANGCNIKPAKK
jgi:hypothetical protein